MNAPQATPILLELGDPPPASGRAGFLDFVFQPRVGLQIDVGDPEVHALGGVPQHARLRARGPRQAACLAR